ETSTSNALVSQCDGTGSYDWSYQTEEELENYALMAFSSSHSSSDNELSPTKPEQDLSHTTRPSAPIIEDWVSDSEDESDTKAPQFVPSFVQSSEQVKTPRHSVQPIETSIPAATPTPASLKSTSSGKERIGKLALGNHKRYASLTHKKPQKHMVPTAVLTQFKPVFDTAVKPVSAVVPKIMVTRPRLAHPIVTKSKSPIRRHITHSPSLKTSNSPPRVTVAQALVGNPQHALKDKGVIDSGCSSTMMTCHLSIRPAATCTVPRTQLLAVSRCHVAASYWTAASDVAPTTGQRRSTPPATGQRRRFTVVISGQRWWSTTVAGGEPPLTVAGLPLTTTGPPVNGGWWAGQRSGLDRVWAGSGSGLDRVWAGSGSGLDQVWAVSATWHATCAHVSATCANVASTWMLNTYHNVTPPDTYSVPAPSGGVTASFMGFMVYQMHVKSVFLYGNIKEEVYVCQPLGFEDPDNPNKVYKVVKALYDDIIFGATNKDLCRSFEKPMKDKFQMSSMGELTFFLGLQVKQKKGGIFIIQDKYVAEILRKFRLTKRKSASAPIDTEKPLLKDLNSEDVDVHTYTSMIGSLIKADL
nr:hypothetical protein [Tanacetum cinerariifolium]